MRNADLTMKVKFCEKHKYFFENNVKVFLKNRGLAISPYNLVKLIRRSEKCPMCQWETTFGKDKHKIGRKRRC